MKLKQVLILFMRILNLVFLSLLIYYIISEITGHNTSVGLVIAIIVAFCAWLLSLAFLGQYVGCPSNAIYESDVVLSKEIVIVEESPNVWKIKNSNAKLDMSGWLMQKYYIAKLISGIICIKQYNYEKQSAFSLPFGSQTVKPEKTTLVFINLKGKKKSKTIVKNNKVKKGLNLRFRFFCSLKSTPTHQRKYNDFKYYKIEIKDCFRSL